MLKLPRSTSIIGRSFAVKSNRISGDVTTTTVLSQTSPPTTAVGGLDKILTPPDPTVPTRIPRRGSDSPEFDSLSSHCSSEVTGLCDAGRVAEEGEKVNDTVGETRDEVLEEVERVLRDLTLAESHNDDDFNGKCDRKKKKNSASGVGWQKNQSCSGEGLYLEQSTDSVDKTIRSDDNQCISDIEKITSENVAEERTEYLDVVHVDKDLNNVKDYGLVNHRRCESDSGFDDWVLTGRRMEDSLGSSSSRSAGSRTPGSRSRSPRSLGSDVSMDKVESPDDGICRDILVQDVIRSLDKSMRSGKARMSSGGSSQGEKIFYVSPPTSAAAVSPSDENIMASHSDVMSSSVTTQVFVEGGVISLEDFEPEEDLQPCSELTDEFVVVRRRKNQRGSTMAEVEGTCDTQCNSYQTGNRTSEQTRYRSSQTTNRISSTNHNRAFMHRHQAPPRRGGPSQTLNQSAVCVNPHKYSSGKDNISAQDDEVTRVSGSRHRLSNDSRTMPRSRLSGQSCTTTNDSRGDVVDVCGNYERNSELSWIDINDPASSRDGSTTVKTSSGSIVERSVTQGTSAGHQPAVINSTQHRGNYALSNNSNVTSSIVRASSCAGSVSHTTGSQTVGAGSRLAVPSQQNNTVLPATGPKASGSLSYSTSSKPEERSIAIQCDLELELKAAVKLSSERRRGAVQQCEPGGGQAESGPSQQHQAGVTHCCGFSLSAAQSFVYTDFKDTVKNLSQDTRSVQTYG